MIVKLYLIICCCALSGCSGIFAHAPKHTVVAEVEAVSIKLPPVDQQDCEDERERVTDDMEKLDDADDLIRLSKNLLNSLDSCELKLQSLVRDIKSTNKLTD